MQLVRDLTENGCGKYAAINIQRLAELSRAGGAKGAWSADVAAALQTLEAIGVLEWGRKGQADEFFLIKLKDENAQEALTAYANKAAERDKEYAAGVMEMALRAGPSSPFCKTPD